MTRAEVDQLKYGLYRIFWKGDEYEGTPGGDSVGAVGGTHSGERWLACTNWTTEDREDGVGNCDSWERVERVQRVG